MTGKEIAGALRDVFTSPNVLDSNWETANLVDAMDSIRGAIMRHADAIEKLADAISEDCECHKQ